MKWAGYKTTEQSSKKEMKLITNCKKYSKNIDECGVKPDKLNQVLTDFTPLNIKDRIISPNIDELNKALDEGNSVIIRYLWKKQNKSGGHYILCIGRTDKTYTVVNDNKSKTVSKRTRKVMNRILDGTLNDHTCQVWIVGK